MAESDSTRLLTKAEADAIALAIEASLRRDFGAAGLANPEGYGIVDVRSRFYMKRHVPVVMLERGGKTLGFIITPSDPSERVYARTARYDIVYFTEDETDEKQDNIYGENRPMIDRFVGWVGRWDRKGA